MKRLLVDTNVVLDVLLDRKPHANASAAVWAAIETGRAEGFLPAHAVTTIFYLARKELGQVHAKKTVTALLRVFRVAAIDGDVLRLALEGGGTDFEDQVSAAAAMMAGCDAIVARDPKGFAGSAVRVIAPEAAAVLLSR